MSAKYLQSLDELKAKKKQQVKENVQSSQEKSGQLKKFFTQFEVRQLLNSGIQDQITLRQ